MARWLAPLAILVASGCVDPSGKYDAFVERALTDSQGRRPSGGGSDAALPEPEQIEGRFLMAVTLDLYPEDPTGYELELQATRKGDVYEMSLRQRPLRFREYMTPVGEWSDWLTSELSEQGVYETPEPVSIDVPAEANVLNLDTHVNLFLRGDLSDAVEGDDGKMAFWCGEVWGDVRVYGITMAVEGAFTAARIREGEDFPTATLDCDGEPVPK